MTRRHQIAAVIACAIATGAMPAAQERPNAGPSRTVTLTGCVQRIDESGSLDTTIPERTPTPEQAGTAANSG